MVSVEEIYELVEQRRSELGLSQARVSEMITGKEGDTSLIQNLRRGKIPRADKLAEISKVLGLEFYFGPVRDSQELMSRAFGPLGGLSKEQRKQVLKEAMGALWTPDDSSLPDDTDIANPDLIYLPEYDVRASAGPGAEVSSEVIVQDVGFQERFLRDLGATPNKCSIIRASGDSMEPTIPDGSLLVVDHSQANINGGGIYVLSVSDDLLVKRARRRIDSKVDLISDNQMYPPETIAPDRMDELRVVGRVVYFCRAP